MSRALKTCHRLVLCLANAFLLSTLAYASGSFNVIYSFSGTTDGGIPNSNLIFDSAGNLYGTTSSGGSAGQGTVFELTPNGGGTWSETVLYNFQGTPDGAGPAAGLIFDTSGNLIGTTAAGGLNNKGTVFKLTPSQGFWTESILHTFGSATDGSCPMSAVIEDSSGNLFGTTLQGGSMNWGTVYELTPGTGGTWKEKILYNFRPGKYGVNPIAGVTMDASGNLYGATAAGGALAYGNIFKLTKSGNSYVWSALYAFRGGNDGGSSYSTPVFDVAGNLYGTTLYRGAKDAGTVFQLQPTLQGPWKFVLLHSFTGNDGGTPNSGVILDAAGNVYGTTQGDSVSTFGTLYKVALGTNGKWSQTILHLFTGGSDGSSPLNVPVLDSSGNLYGTTSGGGTDAAGVAFEWTAAGLK